MLKFSAVNNEIHIEREDGKREKTLLVVGGSFSLAGLAREIAEVLNQHYSKSK